jgi:hypothetical protein
MSQTSDGPENQLSRQLFSLEFSAEGGPRLGADVSERQSVLRIHGNPPEATFEYHGSSDNTTGAAIGRFRVQMNDGDVARVNEASQRIAWNTLPAPSGGGPGTTVMTLRVRTGETQHAATYTSRDAATSTLLKPLLSELSAISAKVRNSPEAAVALRLSRAEGRFVLTMVNVGRLPICFTAPDRLGVSVAKQWAGVQLAQIPIEQAGVTSPPLQWQRIALQSDPGASPIVQLRAGESIRVVTAAWSPRERGAAYLAQAVVSNYVDAPAVPDCYPIRGVVTSTQLTVSQ